MYWHSKVILYIDFIYIISRSKWQKKMQKSHCTRNGDFEWLFSSLFVEYWTVLRKIEIQQHHQFKHQHNKQKRLTLFKKESIISKKLGQKLQNLKRLNWLIQTHFESISHQRQICELKIQSIQQHADKQGIFHLIWMALLLWKHLFDEKLKCSAQQQKDKSTIVLITDKNQNTPISGQLRKAPFDWCFFHTKYFLS